LAAVEVPISEVTVFLAAQVVVQVKVQTLVHLAGRVLLGKVTLVVTDEIMVNKQTLIDSPVAVAAQVGVE
jgi:hypothetical protein